MTDNKPTDNKPTDNKPTDNNQDLIEDFSKIAYNHDRMHNHGKMTNQLSRDEFKKVWDMDRDDADKYLNDRLSNLI